MATYTSTQDGNWNTDATWGGGGHPSLDNDLAVIGHVVTYDAGDSAVTWGNVTVNNGGRLVFPAAASSTILFNATGILTVNSGGEVRTGANVGDEVGTDYHLYMQWPQGAAVRNVFVLNNGGILNINGDAAFYGGSKYAYLESDWASGQTLYVTGDFSAKWRAGQKFYIHENIAYDSYQNDGHIYTIDSVGAYDSGNDRTPLVIVEGAPGLTFNATYNGHLSKLIMISRNVTAGDPGAGLTVYGYQTYTERLVFDNNQLIANFNIALSDIMFYGWDKAIDGGTNYVGQDIVFVSNNNGLYSSNYNQITGDFVSNNYGLYSNCNYNQITGDFVSNTWIANSYFSGTVLNWIFGGDIDGNTNIVDTSGMYKISLILEDCTVSGANRRPQRIYEGSGTFLPLSSGDGAWQVPPSGNAWIFQASPNSYCTPDLFHQLVLSPMGMVGDWCTSGAKTLTLKIYPVGWGTTLDQDDIFIEAFYLDGTGVSRSKVVTGVGTFANNGWRDLTVAFTAGQDGIVYFQMYIRRYEASAYVLIDPVWTFAEA